MLTRHRVEKQLVSFFNRLPLPVWSLYNSIRCEKRFTNDVSKLCEKIENPRQDDTFHVRNFHQILSEKTLPFWAGHTVDSQYGGYHVHLDRNGKLYQYDTKSSAMHARMVYSFSLGNTLDPHGGYLKLAEHGVEFLINKFWDNKWNGWFRTVDKYGSVVDNRKHIFDHTYLIIGFCQYYIETKDSIVREYLEKTADLLEDRFKDNEHDGYLELFKNDWCDEWDIKTACGHLDTLAAMLQMERALGDTLYRKRVEKLTGVILSKMMSSSPETLLEHFSRSWDYLPYSTNDQIENGHNLKLIWLLLRVYELFPDNYLVEVSESLMNNMLIHGWNPSTGGFYQDSFRSGEIASTVKLWWPECEGLLSLSKLYQITNENRYLTLLNQLCEFVALAFWNPDCGDLYTAVNDGDVVNPAIGGNYKSAFHTVEALYYSAKALNRS